MSVRDTILAGIMVQIETLRAEKQAIQDLHPDYTGFSRYWEIKSMIDTLNSRVVEYSPGP